MEKKFKFNIVDILVIAVLIVGIAFVGIKLLGGGDAVPAAQGTYQVTFFAECVPEAVKDHLTVGSGAENDEGTVALGELIRFSTGDSIVYVTLESGEIIASTKPGYISCTLTCQVSGQQTAVGLLVGAHELNVGHEMIVRAGNTEVKCYVQDITAVEAE